MEINFSDARSYNVTHHKRSILMNQLYSNYQSLLGKAQLFDGLAPLLLRLYLAPVFIQAGWTKWQSFDATVMWFGDKEWGLGMPFPELMVTLAMSAEIVGGALLFLGLLTRLVAIPLMFTMAVAAITAHWQNGWLALADSNSWFADGTLFYNESIMAAAEKKQRAIEILQEYGNYEWLSSSGSFTILNNGIEFAATYFIMTLVLFFTGGGRFTSVDYFVKLKIERTE